MEDRGFSYLYYRCRACKALTRPYSIPDTLINEVLQEILGVIPVKHGMHEKVHHCCDDHTWGVADFECISSDPNLATD